MMKTRTLLSIVTTLLISTVAAGSALAQDFATDCASVVAIKTKGTVYKNSAPLRGPGHGAIVGFRKEPTLIMNQNISDRKKTTIYDSLGNKLARCPWASAEGTRGGRFRCTIKTIALRRKAVTMSQSPTIFFRVKPGTCVQVPDAGKCYGSTKGLCNRTLK